MSKTKNGISKCSGTEFYRDISNLFCRFPRHHVFLLYSTIFFCLLSMVGFITNISILCFLILFISLQNRIKKFISSTGDSVAQAILFFILISPCGLSFSIDSFFLNGSFFSNFKIPGFSILCLQWMVILMYFFAAICKLNDKAWLDGTIILVSTRSPIWSKKLKAGGFFEKHEIFNFILSRIVICYQFFGILFLWPSETKRVYAGLGILIHLSMTALMNLGYFGQVMALSLLSFMI